MSLLRKMSRADIPEKSGKYIVASENMIDGIRYLEAWYDLKDGWSIPGIDYWFKEVSEDMIKIACSDFLYSKGNTFQNNAASFIAGAKWMRSQLTEQPKQTAVLKLIDDRINDLEVQYSVLSEAKNFDAAIRTDELLSELSALRTAISQLNGQHDKSQTT